MIKVHAKPAQLAQSDQVQLLHVRHRVIQNAAHAPLALHTVMLMIRAAAPRAPRVRLAMELPPHAQHQVTLSAVLAHPAVPTVT